MALTYTLPEMKRMEVGDYGATFINGTDPVTGYYWKVVAVAATVFATGTIFNGGTNPFSTQSFPALYEIMGNFTSIELVSGSIMAYKYKS